jgi:multicomponent Na+:H+ antiporter subunit B
MSPRTRTVVFVIFAAIGFGVLLYSAVLLPQFGAFSGAYSSFLLRTGTMARSIENIATAVNFDYRGFDTMGEEFIFFTSVTGVLFMLSGLHARTEQHQEAIETPETRGQSGAIRLVATGTAAFVAAMAMYEAAHTTATPGGGFQGGAIFGSAFVLVYLGVGYGALMTIAKRQLFEPLKAFGAACYVFLGVATAFAAGAFLKNSLYTGQPGAIVNGGLVYLINAAVFIEIGCGFVVLLTVFIHQTRQVQESEE